MDYRKILAMMAAALVVQGCSSMSGQECAVADWQSVGYEDGVRGSSADRIGNYRKACAKHGVSPDLQAYREGRAAGLREFCRPDNGYNLGVRGRSYNGVCPADLDEEFFAAYQSGKRLYTLRRAVSSIESQIRSNEERVDDIEDEIAGMGMRIIASETTSEERAQLLVKTKNLAEERGRLESELDELRAERVQAKAELNEYEATQARL